jgi:hypothetical protein
VRGADSHRAGVVARYSAKLLLRNNLFRVLVAAMIVWITWLLMVMLSNIVIPHFGGFGMSALLPHANAYLFAVLLVLPLVACSGPVLSRNRQVDSASVLDARPGSNVARVTGVAWGVTRVCLWLAAVSAVLAATLHLSNTEVTLRVEEYLFYFLTLTLPAVIFFTGFSLFVNSAVGNKGIACMIQLLVMGLLGWCFNSDTLDFIDPFGIARPNALSRITGHPDLAGYLVQRAGWLCCGLAFTGMAVLARRRLPDTPRERKMTGRVTAVLALLFVAGAGWPLHERLQFMEARQRYTAAYAKYRDHDKLSMTAQEIRFEQEGTRVKGHGTLQVVNNNEREVSPVILYLNPGLRVERLRVDGEEMSFERAGQVIIVQAIVPSGASREIDVEYSGEIDERACYLDVDEEKILATFRRASTTGCRYGNRYAYAGEEYTLLVPAALWYPVAHPPENPNKPFDVERDFTRYTLRVKIPTGQLAVSQGAREERGDTMIFRPEYPLDGITLCTGDYTRRTVTLSDSTVCELYLHEGVDMKQNAIVQEIVKDTLPRVLERFKETLEESRGKYPFKRFMLVETPVAFASFYRHNHGGSEYVQPEMALVPEIIMDKALQHFKYVLSLLEYARKHDNGNYLFRLPTNEESLAEVIKGQILAPNFSQHLVTYYDNYGSFIKSYFSRREANGRKNWNNPYELSSLFRQHRGWINAPAYPGLNLLLEAVMNKRGNNGIEHAYRGMDIVFLNNYLGRHGFDEALDTLYTTSLFHDLLVLKATSFRDQLFLAKVLPDEWERFYLDFRERHGFCTVEFPLLQEEFLATTGIDLNELLREVYRVKELPAYLFGDARVERVAEDDEIRDFNRYRFHWNVMNTGKERGVLSLLMTYTMSYRGKPLSELSCFERQFEIGPGEARELVITASFPVYSMSMYANTGVSRNVPFLVEHDGPNNSNILRASPVTRDTSSGSRVIDPALFLVARDTNEIIVDNDDAGFSLRHLPGIFSRKREITPEYQDRFTFPRHDPFGSYPRWTRFGDASRTANATGTYITKTAGSGREEATWRTRIEKKGIYEIFAYMNSSTRYAQDIIARKQSEYSRKNRKKIDMNRLDQYTPVKTPKFHVPVLHQYYIVSHDDGESTAIVTNNSDDDTWISLGKYHLSPGEHVVRLRDKRDHPDQPLYADAVKWVYTGAGR